VIFSEPEDADQKNEFWFEFFVLSRYSESAMLISEDTYIFYDD
jgi:hypothetical protein